MSKFLRFSKIFIKKPYNFATLKVSNTAFKEISSDYTFKIESK